MKKNKKIMATIGLAGACAGISIGTYIMMKNKRSIYKQLMTYENR